jgi:hypothetical protein
MTFAKASTLKLQASAKIKIQKLQIQSFSEIGNWNFREASDLKLEGWLSASAK